MFNMFKPTSYVCQEDPKAPAYEPELFCQNIGLRKFKSEFGFQATC